METKTQKKESIMETYLIKTYDRKTHRTVREIEVQTTEKNAIIKAKELTEKNNNIYTVSIVDDNETFLIAHN
jgi:hypothetical protein